MKRIIGILTVTLLALGGVVNAVARPNILLCISDDQSYAHTGANGDPTIRTPGFDRVAGEGVRFTHAFCDAPSCGPSRSALLTGQHIWRLEEAGNIHSTLPKKFNTYTELLQDAGYFVGHTGKGWSPGRDGPGGRTGNAAGPRFNRMRYGAGDLKNTPRPKGMSSNPYARNFADFLSKRPKGAPFCFWLGTYEPHRGYERDLWKAKGKDPAKVIVPPCLPDHPTVRTDILDYQHEVEHFDKAVVDALALIEKLGELDNTIVVVTSDHGMPFPRAKASLYDAGTRVPLAIRWPKGVKAPGRVYDGMVNLSDLAPTFLEAAGIKPPAMMTALGLGDVLGSSKTRPRPHAFIAMERHDGCRKGGKGYPCRAIRKKGILYIKNYKPDRWPSGDPDRENCARYIPYGEVDSSPTKQLMMGNADKEGFRRLHQLAFAKRPAEELYIMDKDPGQLVNVARKPEYAQIQKEMSEALQRRLIATKDPRALGKDAPWDFYPYYGNRRNRKWKVDPRPGSIAAEDAAQSPTTPAPKGTLETGINIQNSVDQVAPGWKVERCGSFGNPGLRAQWGGRENVLVTHPLRRGVACTLTRTLTLPAGKPRLRLIVGHDRRGDWQLTVRVDGKDILQKLVSRKATANGWMELNVDLTPHAGTTVTLQLVNHPNNWVYEHGYWGKIAIDPSN